MPQRDGGPLPSSRAKRPTGQPAGASNLSGEILSALERLLDRRPFDEITAGDIIIEAGVSRPTFYKHFTGKLDVVTALAESVIRGIYEGLWHPFFTGPHSRSEEVMTEHWLQTLAVWRENQSVMVAAAQASRADAGCWTALWGPHVATTRDYIERARAEGKAPAELDATVLAMLTVGLIENTFWMRFALDYVPQDDRVLARTLARLFLQGIFGAVPK